MARVVRTARWTWVTVSMLVGCSKPSPNRNDEPLAAVGPGKVSSVRCAPRKGTTPYVVGQPSGETGEPDGTLVDVPFAAEVGAAVAVAGGFAVPVLRAVDNETRAGIVLVASDGSSGRVVELGAVHGGAPPPRIAGGTQPLLVVAAADTDASGGTLRVASITGFGPSAKLVWGQELQEGWDPSTGFDVALCSGNGLLVWDQGPRASDRSEIRVSSFRETDVKALSDPKVVSGKLSAESPRVVARPGGFWLAWIARALGPPGGAQSHRAQASAEAELALDLGYGSLQVVGLNAAGVPDGDPVQVTAGSSHVLAFDIEAAPDGGALLAWRDDPTSPGTEQELVQLGHVRPDGTVERHQIRDEAIGAGAPELMADSSATRGVWLAVAQTNDRVRLARLSDSGRPLEGSDTGMVDGITDVLAVQSDRFLVGKPRGRALELFVVDCAATVAPR